MWCHFGQHEIREKGGYLNKTFPLRFLSPLFFIFYLSPLFFLPYFFSVFVLPIFPPLFGLSYLFSVICSPVVVLPYSFSLICSPLGAIDKRLSSFKLATPSPFFLSGCRSDKVHHSQVHICNEDMFIIELLLQTRQSTHQHKET